MTAKGPSTKLVKRPKTRRKPNGKDLLSWYIFHRLEDIPIQEVTPDAILKIIYSFDNEYEFDEVWKLLWDEYPSFKSKFLTPN